MKSNLLLLVSLCSFHFALSQSAFYPTLAHNHKEGDYEACLKFVADVEKLSITNKDTLSANSFSFVGDAYYQLGKLDKALPWFEREKKLRAALGLTGTEEYSSTLYNLAYINLQAGHYPQAGIAADQLIENDKKRYGPSADDFVFSVLTAVDIYIQLDRFNDAEKLLQSTIKRQAKGAANQGILLNTLGDLYTLTNQFSKATKTLSEAASILEKTPGPQSQEFLNATINKGILYMTRGKYPEAEEAFDYVLSHLKSSDRDYLATLNNQALIYQYLGQFDRAEKKFLEIKSRDSISVGVMHPDFALTLSNLGVVFSDEGKHGRAERVLLQSLDIQKKLNEGKTVSFARKLSNLARVYRVAGSPAKAIPLLEQALMIYKNKLDDKSPEYATAAYSLGIAHWKNGKGTLGFKYLKTSAAIRTSKLGKNHPKTTESLQKIGEYHWEQKQLKDAYRSFGQVFDNYYQQIGVTFPALTEEEKAKFYYNNIKPAIEKYNSFAMDYYKENPLVLGDVYNYQVNTKAAIMYATEKVKQAIHTSKDTVLIKDFETWQEQKEQIAKLYSQNTGRAKLDSLIRRTDQLEKELTRKSAVFAKQFTRKNITWQEIQRTLKNDEAAIEVVRFRSFMPTNGGRFQDTIAYALLVLTSQTINQPELIYVNNGVQMEGKLLNSYRNHIQYFQDDERSFANYFKGLSVYLKQNKINKIYFSPDGVYNQINISTIQNPDTKTYLIDEFDIRILTNTREVVESSKSTATTNTSTTLIGFPKFNLESKNVTEPGAHSMTRDGTLTRTLRGGLLRVMRGDEGISVLPGTQKEIQLISQLTSKPDIYLEERAGEGVLKNVKSPGVLHIATHGYFLEEDDVTTQADDVKSDYVPNPLLKAGIILAGAENFLRTGIAVNDAGDDGILTAYEAMNLNLDNTDLVVLSACETGLGVVKNGEGVYGLQRAFTLAGARNLIMSLWSVDDAATQELMSLFYEEKLKNKDLHVAFRTAQQNLKAKYPDPFYWGAFIMVGI